MTYLEAVNSVLIRMREDTVLTLQGTDDVVVDLVERYVNDAVLSVAQSHTWSALLDTWVFNTTEGASEVVLSGDSKVNVIDVIYAPNGMELRNESRARIIQRRLAGDTTGTPNYYAVNGKAGGQVTLTMWPTPVSAESFTVVGHAEHGVLSEDSDVITVPFKPVEHLALVYAARERGEVGAQTVPELMSIASQSLSDAIALDAANTPLDNLWISV